MLLTLAAFLIVAGCATPDYVVIDGKRVERPSVAYDNGVNFHLEHNRAYPGVFDPLRPQSIDDGTLEGHICGVDMHFDASWYGARLHVGMREFALTANDEFLFGRYKRHGDVPTAIDVPYAIYGRQALASMVPADQALLLVLMLTCNGPAIERDGKMVRGFSIVSLPPKSPSDAPPPSEGNQEIKPQTAVRQ